MSDEEKTKPADEEEPIPDDAPDSAAMKALLKRSFAVADEPAPSPSAKTPVPSDADKELLRKVQTKLRQRSKGKFYGDGWSTTQSRLNYALIAAVMLVTIVAVYLALGPTGISR